MEMLPEHAAHKTHVFCARVSALRSAAGTDEHSLGGIKSPHLDSRQRKGRRGFDKQIMSLCVITAQAPRFQGK